MKKLILVIVLLTTIIPFTFSFSEESRDDLRRAARWWGDRESELNIQLGELRRRNPDPSDPEDKNWQEYLRVTSEIQKALEKQKLYEETVLFNYHRTILRDTVQVYKPVGDFIEMTAGRGVELFIAAVTANWMDLVKLSVDSILKSRIRGKIRSILECSETVPELEDWLVVIGFGNDPWATTIDQALLNWAKGDAQGKALLLSLQAEKGRQIYNTFLKTPNKFSDLTAPAKWLEGATQRSAKEIMDKFGMATFIADMAGKMWLSFEMDESIDNTLMNLKAMKDKYAESENDLSCEDVFLVWSKQKSVELIDPNEKKRLDELKLGLEFFMDKIPGWNESGTVENHFDEILRMIPIAEEIGEQAKAQKLRELLVKFDYHELTPDEIAKAENDAAIEETKRYLITSLTTLRKYLVNKDYAEVENQWDRVQRQWKELISRGYNTDTDKNIQTLWVEVQPMLIAFQGRPAKDPSSENSNSSDNLGSDMPLLNEVDYKEKFLIIAKKYNDAVQIKNYSRAKSFNTIFKYYGQYLYKEHNISISYNEEWFKVIGKYFEFNPTITSMIDDSNSLLNNPSYHRFKSEVLSYYREYEALLFSVGEDAIDNDLKGLESHVQQWGLLGIDFWDDGFKDPEINARREEIEDLEESIRDGETTPSGD